MLEKTLESPLDSKEIKLINPKGLMLKLKLLGFGHLIQRTDLLEKTLMLGKMTIEPLWLYSPGINAVHSTILSSVSPFYSCLQSFPASESFPMGQLFASDSQSIEASASASVLPMNVQD